MMNFINCSGKNKLTMKNLKKLNVLLVGTLFMLFTACNGFLNVNDNPNASTTATPAGLLTNVLYQTSQLQYSVSTVTSYYTQQLASPSGSAVDQQREIHMDGSWAEAYNVLTDLKDLDNISEKKGATDYAAIAKIMTAYNLGTATDLWGSMPYSDAFKGAGDLTPSYDSQQQLYSDIQSLLDKAISEIKTGKSTLSPGNDDLYYGGDMQKWLKMAYSLKARYLNHLSKKSNYDPQAVLNNVKNGFQSNNDDARLSYTQDKMNPWAIVVINNSIGILGGDLSAYLVNAMDTTYYNTFDPRLFAMTDSLAGGDFRGTVNGKGSPNVAYNTLTADSYFAQKTSPIQIMTYSEVKFIEAEAAFRAGDKPTAYQAYLDGIKANMDMLGVDSQAENNYLSSPDVAVGAGNLTLSLIFKEKLVALFLQPEAWVDARRFDYQYKDMTVPFNQNPDLNGKYIRRILYPNSELSRNGNNVPNVTLGQHLWWDQQ